MKLLKPIFFFSLFMVCFSPILAQTATPTLTPNPTSSPKLHRQPQNNRRQLHRDLKDFNKEIKKDRQEARVTLSQTRHNFWTQFRQTQVKTIYSIIKNNLTHRYSILLNFKSEIESRLAKKVATGQNLDTAKAKLATFSNPENNYKNHLTTLETKITELLSSSDPKSLVPTLRSQAQQVRLDLKDMQKVLVDTIKLIINS